MSDIYYQQLNSYFQMGNQTANENKIQQFKIISKKEHSHLAQITQMQYKKKMCYQKIYTFTDAFLMEESSRRFKTRINKLSNNQHILNIYHLNKLEDKDLCANNYKLYAYLQYYDQSLQEVMKNRIANKKNFNEAEIYHFMNKVIESLICIQDNGLKNLQLDAESILFCGQEAVKVLDNAIAYSNSYHTFLNNLEDKKANSNEIANSLYLAPQMLKDLKQLNYDPYISPKADIFSLGMLVLEMICLQSLSCYYNYTLCEIDYDSLIHRISKINYSLDLKTLIAQMLEYDPEERIGLVHLQQKINKLRQDKKEVIYRSKSSKMLKQILSKSRSSSLNKQSSEYASEIKISKVELNSSESDKIIILQSSKQISNQSSARKQVSSAYLNKKQSFEYKSYLQPTIQPHQLKNLVKNKLVKENNNQNIVKKNDNYRSEAILLESKTNITKPLVEKNINKFESSLSVHKNIFESSQQDNFIGKLVNDSRMRNILKMQHLDTNKIQISNKNSNDSQKSKFISRFANIDSLPMIAKLNEKQNLCKAIKTEWNSSNLSFLEIESRQKGRMINKLTENNQPFTSRNNERKSQLMNAMTFKNKELGTEKMGQNSQKQDQGKKMEKFIYSPINFSRFEEVIECCEQSNGESPSMKIKIDNIPVVISQGKSSQKDQESQIKIEKHIQNKLFNLAQDVYSIKQETPISNSKITAQQNKIEQFHTYHTQLQDENWLFENIKAKKPNLNFNIDSLYDSCKDLNKFNYKPHSIQAKGRQPYDAIQNQTKFEGMYKTSKSIEQISQFISIDGKNRDSKNDTINNLFTPFDKYQSQDKTKGSIFSKIKLSNGDIYEGQLSVDNKFQGNGRLYNSINQIIYSGSWKNGLRHGFGTYHNSQFVCLSVDYKNLDLKQSNWLKYEGEFENGYHNGFGTIYYPQGQKFSGCLKMDVVEGYGCFYKSSGELVSGLWKENKLKNF